MQQTAQVTSLNLGILDPTVFFAIAVSDLPLSILDQLPRQATESAASCSQLFREYDSSTNY